MDEPTSPPAPSVLPQLGTPGVQWFEQEVRRHEAHLKAYLRGSFPSVRDVDDVVQESYLRIWKARAGRPIQSARAFLFRVARNVAIDLVRRNQKSPIEDTGDLGGMTVAEESLGAPEKIATEEKLQLLAESIAALPERCRTIVVMCKIRGLTHREAAAQLGIAEKTVDEHVFRGFQRLDEELRKRGISSPFKG